MSIAEFEQFLQTNLQTGFPKLPKYGREKLCPLLSSAAWNNDEELSISLTICNAGHSGEAV